MPVSKLKLGTRGSRLALAQAHQIAEALTTASDGAVACEVKPLTTSGDRLTTERLIDAGGKGLFTRELDRALDDKAIDIAVHSLKDVPARLPDGQDFVAFPAREDPREAFVSADGTGLHDLPEGCVIGTASLRRQAQTLLLRPDARIVTFRGNVQTRLDKLAAGQAAGTWLALAGLNRLGLADKAAEIMPVETMCPAPCQGIIAVTARRDRLSDTVLSALNAITDEPTQRAALAERAFLTRLDGSCRTPIAAHLTLNGTSAALHGEVLEEDGTNRYHAADSLDLTGLSSEQAEIALGGLGLQVAETVLDACGGALPKVTG